MNIYWESVICHALALGVKETVINKMNSLLLRVFIPTDEKLYTNKQTKWICNILNGNKWHKKIRLGKEDGIILGEVVREYQTQTKYTLLSG